jgi:competence protein ComEC
VDIDALWLARPHPGARAAPSYRDLLAELRARGTRIVYPPLGRPLVQGGAQLVALAPRYLDGIAAADPVSSINDNSLVVRVAFAGRSVLFTGDIEKEGEELLMERYGDALRADVLKVPHHGSPTSSTAAFAARVAPAWAVISCGLATRFGFPAPAVVARWQAAGARVLRTDRVGAVTVVISPDGGMRVEAFDGLAGLGAPPLKPSLKSPEIR